MRNQVKEQLVKKISEIITKDASDLSISESFDILRWVEKGFLAIDTTDSYEIIRHPVQLKLNMDAINERFGVEIDA